MIPVAIALAVLVGLSLGLLGGGGSILTVPLLVYVAGVETKAAIATSLLVVGVTSAVGALSHARAGRVQWRTGLLFGGAGMVGAYAGGRLAQFIPGEVLLLAFALMMIITAVAMLRGRKNVDPSKVHGRLPVGRVLLDGAVVGLVTGLVGAGGGFLVVPALALLGGLPMPVAVGTSLVVIAIKSFGGLAGYLASVQVDWGLALGVTAAAVVGALLGGRLVGRTKPDTLRKAFGWFVLVMGAFILVQEAPADWRLPAVGALAALVAAGGAWVLLRRRR
ncbi:MAG: sulfite exporter TauE/SafE family protein, partial [Actinotalea sp.]|nr:sulfite exporter TauE/SafE family protein [Actinotalea sp.]